MSFASGADRPFKDPRLRNVFDEERARRQAVDDARILRDLAQGMHEVDEHEGARLLELEAEDADVFARECEKAVAIETGVLQRAARAERGGTA